LKIIQQLVNASDLIGPGLVPFYRQLLPVFNAYKIRNSKSPRSSAFFTLQLTILLFSSFLASLWSFALNQ
jgi:outer membrane phospholipase A